MMIHHDFLLLISIFILFVLSPTNAQASRCIESSSLLLGSSCEDSSDTTTPAGVACGGPPGSLLNCIYRNLCLAEEAGFLSCDCCPIPTAISTLTSNLESVEESGDPVYCGTYSCPYDSIDNAMNAGWTEDECEFEMPTCPETCSGCKKIYEPVVCGENKCLYNNMCTAEGAHFEANDCCPASRISDEFCAEIYQPVTCGRKGCQYDNLCFAKQADFDDDDCCLVPIPIAVCPEVIDPVVCGSAKCRYNNQCLAEAVGYKVEDCCPVATEDTYCTADYEPHICDGCEYSNSCWASAAGFNVKEDCSSIIKPICPVAAATEDSYCTEDYEPHICDGCEYSNSCWASAAGFNVKEDCSSILDPICPLPTHALKKRCRKEDRENARRKVACGSCTFDNFCIAEELGGYSKEECCPKLTGQCSREKSKMKCDDGEYSKCKYRNRCYARKAGFNVKTDCKKMKKKVKKIGPE